jgi:prevent-host-death family protein
LNRTVNIGTAKATLSKLLSEVEAGSEIVIARAGKPVAKLVPLNRPDKRCPDRRPGFLKEKIRLSRDFEAPLPDEVFGSTRSKRN